MSADGDLSGASLRSWALRANARLALWAAAITVVLTVIGAVLAVTTPPRSGPMCQLEHCVGFPYTDVAAYVPRDYLWMYPTIALELSVVVLVAALVALAPPSRRGIAIAAMGFTVLGITLLVADYGVQLFVVQPSLLAGQTEGLTLWSQYNPHGLFIALENIGYATVALGLAGIGATLAEGRRILRTAQWVLVVGGVLTWIALIGFAVGYGADLEYRFELASISLHWLTLAVGGVLLAVHYRRVAPREDP